MNTKTAANHMSVYWHNYAAQKGALPITEADLKEKASVVGRVGLMLLSCGTGAWRVRSSMNTIAQELGITCTADIGLMSIEYTCFDGENCFTQALSLTNTGVNTHKLYHMERFVREFVKEGKNLSGEELHSRLDEIDRTPGLYRPLILGLASALACGGFTFLLGGGVVEIICAFLGAGCGNYLRARLLKNHMTLYLCIVTSVSLACLVYTGAIRLAETIFAISVQHEAGYVCCMLFIIPGFPMITSGIDMAKLDMRSGIERLTYAVMIVVVATVTAWITALILHLEPSAFPELVIAPAVTFILRLVASFCGVFGFSVMFNSPRKMAASAGVIGSIANTLRLELVDFAGFPPAGAAFVGALTAGLLAFCINKRLGYPRISLTVPSIVIMVPGLYMYRAAYNMGILALGDAATWLASAVLIVLSLPLGLIFARILTDGAFRRCN